MADASVSASAPANYSPGWYAVVTSTGYSGLVKHHGNGPINVGANGTVTGASFVAAAKQTVNQFMSSGAQIKKIATALTSLGSPLTAAQIENGLTQQSDTASAKDGDGGAGATLTQLLLDSKGNAKASAGTTSVSTTPSGDAQDESVGQGVSGTLSGILTWITSPSSWLLILKYVGGAVLLFFGLRELVDNGGR